MVELPPKYYHTNFEYLLSFVKDKYKTLLIEQEWRFLRKYYSLPEDAQCLFIRFTNRKGLFFKTEGLKYDELEEIPNQVDLLKKQNFITSLDFEEHKLWLGEILAVLTKADLVSIFELKNLKNEKREVLVDFVKSEFAVAEIFEKINANQTIVKMNFEQEVSFLRFLFFGNKSMDMTEFVLRDMGLVQYYQHSDDDLVARFETRKDAEDKWMVSEQFVVFDSLKNESSDSEILDWYSNLYQTCQDLSPIALPSFQKLQLRIGKYFEQRKNYQAAIEVFDETQIVPSRERKARCLAKLGYIE
ncbi:MAG: VRR-NUC domain-containing protein, partial [Leadbetterella sp.]|nr:VRR-NUC domain-containing protein [Leadbetterella sp.]